MKAKHLRPLPSPLKASSLALFNDLTSAADLVQRRKWDDALDILTNLQRSHPRSPEVLLLMADALQGIGDQDGLLVTLTRLADLLPHDADVQLGLAGTYLSQAYPALALTVLRRYLREHPDHEAAPEARLTASELEAVLAPLLDSLGLGEGSDFDALLELAGLHEQLMFHTSTGNYVEARRFAERLLRKRPQFVPALNNLSLIYLAEGDLHRALSTARRVQEVDPTNFHALANEVRFLCQDGRFETAREPAERLKAVRSELPELWLKQAEAFSFLGDDEAVLAALAGARKAKSRPESGLLYHLAAVAALRLGDTATARRHWRQALKLEPYLTQAQNNLDDLKKPVGERHGPWSFDPNNWIPRRTILELTAVLEKAARHGTHNTISKAMQRFTREHPELVRILPALLDRAGPEGATFALHFARALRTPEVLHTLQKFALGQQGSDAARIEAAQLLRETEVLPAGMVRLWIEGAWRELLLLEFEIDPERHPFPHAPAVQNLAEDAIQAMHERRPAAAEALIRKALEAEPNSPDLINNLASAVELQGRPDESRAMLADLFARFPDYLFARTGMANHAILTGDLDRAQELLHPILQRTSFHPSEFSALCQVEIALQEARGEQDGAQAWLQIWEEMLPDDPHQERWAQRLLLHELERLVDFTRNPKKARRTERRAA
jgi:tetratricopeptide (TPR) repeat protein